jgi:hypothetical protein
MFEQRDETNYRHCNEEFVFSPLPIFRLLSNLIGYRYRYRYVGSSETADWCDDNKGLSMSKQVYSVDLE